MIKILLQPFVSLYKGLERYECSRSHKKSIANSAAGSFEGRITRQLNSDIPRRGLLVKASPCINSVEIAQANDLPQGIAMSAGKTDDAIAIQLLGSSTSTLKMIAAGPIAYGSLVYTADNGCVQTKPTTPGYYYCIGQSLNDCHQAGDTVEVDAYGAIFTEIL